MVQTNIPETLYTKNWRRATTQELLSNITTTAEAFNYIHYTQKLQTLKLRQWNLEDQISTLAKFKLKIHTTRHVTLCM
jgi:predicted  nucleic acid-binding Zn-ribbon protein